MKESGLQIKHNGGFDLIGDIHGYAQPLRRLLGRLGYQEFGGNYRHPSRKVIFLGDFIDRGPAIRETLHIVRSMIESGAALAVMGNHEFNALCYHSLGQNGEPLRPHSGKNRQQHQATLNAFADHQEEWRHYLAWFLSLPLYLDFGKFRVVHACWDERLVARLKDRNRLDEEQLQNAAHRGTPEFEIVDTLLKGREVKLPEGHYYSDKGGCHRCEIRTAWWLNAAGKTYRDLVFPPSTNIPAIPVPEEQYLNLGGYPAAASPVFIGHYWLAPDQPKLPVAPNVVCLDYSVAKGGLLAAYRWNENEPLNGVSFITSR